MVFSFPDGSYNELPQPVTSVSASYKNGRFLGATLRNANASFQSTTGICDPTDPVCIFKGLREPIADRAINDWNGFVSGFHDIETREGRLLVPVSTIEGMERYLVQALASSSMHPQALGIERRNILMTFTNIEQPLVEIANSAALDARDPLTRLPNRSSLENRIEELKKIGMQYALLMLDLDRFKKINEEKGHEGGDAALIDVANVLRQAISITSALATPRDFQTELALLLQSATRQSPNLKGGERRHSSTQRDLMGLNVRTNQVVRWGGDEFVILLPDCTVDGIKIVEDRIATKLILRNEAAKAKNSPQIGLSLGSIHSSQLGSGESPIDAADRKLAQQKARSRLGLLIKEGGMLLAHDAISSRAFSDSAAAAERLVKENILPGQEVVGVLMGVIKHLAISERVLPGVPTGLQDRFLTFVFTELPQAAGISSFDLMRLLTENPKRKDELIMSALKAMIEKRLKS